ncbi:hypothetical protein ACQP2K_24910 [Microbispora siamensis]
MVWAPYCTAHKILRGIVEAICDVHTITGKPEHLALVKLFDLDKLIDACAAGTDVLNGIHANQHSATATPCASRSRSA